MTARPSRPRPRPRSLRSGAFCIALAALLGPWAGATAQVPDSAQGNMPVAGPAPDTAPAAAPPDTVQRPPEPLPGFGPTGGGGWARGVWEWDREDLLRLPDLSVLHLLERIPGVVPVWPDVANQPEGAAVFGAAAGAVRYIVDGFVVDPLVSPTFDPSRLSLLALERVRVERGATGATVRIETLTPDDARTKSVIEAGTGDYGVNLFRGMFLPPRVLGGSLGLGFERLAANGITPGGSNHNVSWLKWTWAGDSAGVQVEFRRSNLDRQGVGPGVVGTRSDWAVRARKAVGPVTAEAYVGASAVRDSVGGAVDTVATVVLREGTPQGGVRLQAGLGETVPVEARVALRFRDHPRLPARELDVGVRSTPLPWLALEGEALHGWWSTGRPTGRWSAKALAGPILGVSVFGEVFRGGAPLGDGPELALPATADSTTSRITREGLRAGVEYQWGGLRVGAAGVRMSADTMVGFGLAFEPAWRPVSTADARGFEVRLRIPTGFDPLWVDGWYVGMEVPDGWLYLPKYHWRAGLVYHHAPLASNNLEFFARFEHAFRGRMNVPAAAGAGGPAHQEVGAYRGTTFELMIRVVSVRAFLRWNNLFHRLGQEDFPGFGRPGQHLLWGVKWEFWN